jgi:type IV pilus assembly protein PilQ
VVKYDRVIGSLLLGSGAAVALVQPAWAADIMDVRINPMDGGVDVELVTSGGARPQVFLLPPSGNDLVAHIANSRLMVPGQRIDRRSPAAGIDAIEVIQLDATTVQVTVRGAGSRPAGRIRPSSSNNVVLSYVGTGSGAATARTPQAQPQPMPQAQPPSATPSFDPTPGQVMVPNPTVTVDGQPIQPRQAAVPPRLPRAIAPPVGDIATSDIPIRFNRVQLQANPLIPRLVLREAPVREALSLLARAGGVSIAFAEDAGGGGEGGDAGSGSGGGPLISLDVENEPAEDVFNYVLRISGLQANRIGNTVFVGQSLPNTARNVVMRSIRLNQVTADRAAAFLVTLGAESASPATERRTEVIQVQAGAGGQQTAGAGQVTAAPLTQTTTTERTTINELRYDPQDSIPILRGLQVAPDARTNSMTLVGQQDLVALAAEQLLRIDSRLRQVAVNVRVVDINLNQEDRLGTSFSFGVNGGRIVNTGGIGIINWSDRGSPFSPPAISVDNLGESPISIGQGANGPFNFASDFLAQLQATITNGNAKILTDPTLIVQEGQVSQVELTEEVPGNVEIERDITDVGISTTLTITKEKAGLILGISVDRIDDNGFITLSVSPSIRTPIEAFSVPDSEAFVTLLAERKLSSGTVRVRDSQTLVLAGIIQDSDRSDIRKIPILGDLPLLGALFRRTERSSERRELVVLVTPQVLDDSNAATGGYNYTPSREVQELLRERNGGF